MVPVSSIGDRFTSLGGLPISMAIACCNCAIVSLVLIAAACVDRLRLGAYDIGLQISAACLILILRNRQGFFIFSGGLFQQASQRVSRAQIEKANASWACAAVSLALILRSAALT